jgi:predicted nucleic acid-binding protein
MSIAVADTGPLRYLILIDAVDVLPQLFTRVIIPRAVMDELCHPHAPSKVRTWTSTLPEWVEVKTTPQPLENEILGPGENDVISWARQSNAVALLDELEARQTAIQLGLSVCGTVGILAEASNKGLINLQVAFDKLLQTNFRIAPEILKKLLPQSPHADAE